MWCSKELLYIITMFFLEIKMQIKLYYGEHRMEQNSIH